MFHLERDCCIGQVHSIQLKQNFPSSFSLKGIKIALDCANGAGYKAGPALFKSLGAKVYDTGTSPNGLNINLKSGSTYPSKICQMTKKKLTFYF